MATLPQLIEEDIQQLEDVLQELLQKIDRLQTISTGQSAAAAANLHNQREGR